MKFPFSVYLLLVCHLIAATAYSQTDSTVSPEARMAGFVNRFLLQYTNAHLWDSNDSDLVKMHHIKSIQTYYTDCVDLSKKRLKNACFYDSLGRLTEQVSSEHSTNDRVTYRYNDAGQLEEKKLFNTIAPGNPNGHLKKQYTFHYDSMGKLVKIATTEMLDELPHDHGAHYFQERTFYSTDTVLYDFVNRKIMVHHLEADRYLVLTTEDALVEKMYTTTFTFDASGRIQEREYTDNKRNIHFTDRYTDCWGFLTTPQLRNAFVDTCQWFKNHEQTLGIIPDIYVSSDSLFFEENNELFVKYTYLGDVQNITGLWDNMYLESTQKTILIYDASKTRRGLETYVYQKDTLACSQQFIYDKSGRLINESYFSSASWQEQFGFPPVTSSIPQAPVDIHSVTTYEYYENGIVKRVKVSGKYEGYSSCEETFVEYY